MIFFVAALFGSANAIYQGAVSDCTANTGSSSANFVPSASDIVLTLGSDSPHAVQFTTYSYGNMFASSGVDIASGTSYTFTFDFLYDVDFESEDDLFAVFGEYGTNRIPLLISQGVPTHSDSETTQHLFDFDGGLDFQSTLTLGDWYSATLVGDAETGMTCFMVEAIDFGCVSNHISGITIDSIGDVGQFFPTAFPWSLDNIAFFTGCAAYDGYSAAVMDGNCTEQLMFAIDCPTFSPTLAPTFNPSFYPSSTPTATPSSMPTFNPSFVPTSAPTFNPSFIPSFAPSSMPTATPSASFTPTHAPTDYALEVVGAFLFTTTFQSTTLDSAYYDDWNDALCSSYSLNPITGPWIRCSPNNEPVTSEALVVNGLHPLVVEGYSTISIMGGDLEKLVGEDLSGKTLTELNAILVSTASSLTTSFTSTAGKATMKTIMNSKFLSDADIIADTELSSTFTSSFTITSITVTALTVLYLGTDAPTPMPTETPSPSSAAFSVDGGFETNIVISAIVVGFLSLALISFGVHKCIKGQLNEEVRSRWHKSMNEAIDQKKKAAVTAEKKSEPKSDAKPSSASKKSNSKKSGVRDVEQDEDDDDNAHVVQSKKSSGSASAKGGGVEMTEGPASKSGSGGSSKNIKVTKSSSQTQVTVVSGDLSFDSPSPSADSKRGVSPTGSGSGSKRTRKAGRATAAREEGEL